MPDALSGNVDLSPERFRFQLVGEDRTRYLNGQITNQVERATPDRAIPACVCNHKGKLDGTIMLTASDDGSALWIDGPIALRDSLFARLAKYIIADDADLEDITDETTLVHTFGEEGEGRLSHRYGTAGRDWWNVELTGNPVDPVALEQFRISKGVPLWGRELDHDRLPAEARLQLTAVDFHKGCYLGQEVVSRIQSVGRVNRELVILGVSEGTPGASDSIFPTDNQEGKPLGHLTSVAPDGDVALGFVRHTHSDPETELVSVSSDGKISARLIVLAFA